MKMLLKMCMLIVLFFPVMEVSGQYDLCFGKPSSCYHGGSSSCTRCDSWSDCSRKCGGGTQSRYCNCRTETKACAEYCVHGTYTLSRCRCPKWRRGLCCEDCKEAYIAHCMSGRQQCRDSPDAVQCTKCLDPYYSGGYSGGCLAENIRISELSCGEITERIKTKNV